MANTIQVFLEAQTRQFNEALKRADRQVGELTGQIQQSAQQASIALAGLAAGGGLLTRSFLEAAGNFESLRASLVAITGDAGEAEAQFDRLLEFEARTPFNVQDVVAAGVAIRGLGADVDDFLPLAADLSALTGVALPQAARTLAKAANGSQDAITQLNDTFLISRKELKEAGARLKSTGAISADTAEDVEKLQQAILSVGQTKFGGVAAEQAETLNGAFSTLGSAVDKLKVAIGSELATTFFSLARSLTDLVEGFSELPDPIKQVTAFSLVFGTALAGIAAPIAGLVVGFAATIGPITKFRDALAGTAIATKSIPDLFRGASEAIKNSGGVAKAAASGFSALRTAALAALGPVGAFALAAAGAGLLAGGLLTLAVRSIESANRADELALAYEEKVAKSFRLTKEEAERLNQVLSNTPTQLTLNVSGEDAIKNVNVLAKERANLINQIRFAQKKVTAEEETRSQTLDRLAQLNLESNRRFLESNKRLLLSEAKRADSAIKNAEKQIQLRIELINGINERINAQRELADAERKTSKEREAAAKAASTELENLKDIFDQVSDASLFQKEVLLDSVRSQIKALREAGQVTEDQLKIERKLSREVANEKKALAIDEAQSIVDQVKARGGDVLTAEINALNKILSRQDLTDRERAKFGDELAIKRIEQEQRKTNAVREQSDKRREIAARTAELELQASESEIAALERRAKKGEDVLAQLRKELRARQDAAIEEARIAAEKEKEDLRLQAARDISADPDRAAAIRKQTADQIATIERGLAAQIKAIRNETTRDIDAAEEAASRRRIERSKREVDQLIRGSEQALRAELRSLDERERKLDELESKGLDVEAQRIQLINERSKIEKDANDKITELKIKQIELDRELEVIGKGKADAALSQKDAELDIVDIKSDNLEKERQINQAQKNTTKELKSQKEAAEEVSTALDKVAEKSRVVSGEAQSAADAFSDLAQFEDSAEQRQERRAREREEERRRRSEGQATQAELERQAQSDQPGKLPTDIGEGVGVRPERQQPEFRGTTDIPTRTRGEEGFTTDIPTRTRGEEGFTDPVIPTILQQNLIESQKIGSSVSKLVEILGRRESQTSAGDTADTVSLSGPPSVNSL